MIPIFRTALAACAALPFAAVAVAQVAASTGSVPYATLYQTLKPAREAASHPHLKIVPHISSHLDGVRPETIRLVVQSSHGARPLTVAPDGAIDFPLEDALLSENPTITTNQPKGSLSLGVALELSVPANRRWPCKDVLAGLVEAEPVIAEMPAQRPGGVRGVEILFPKNAGAQVVVHGQSDRLLLADEDGRVVLMRDPDLAESGAVLELSATPLRAQPYLAN
jgi:hypothetical protein